ncbi:MAG: SpoIIE family protein phosphatase [Candidatus Aminicenantes bacterium]|nr:SpoIIE family protein phosphatase [Candidatus Aminicenantes bacterium]
MKELLEKATHFRKEFGDLYGVIDLNSLLDKIADKMRQYVNCRESAIFLYNAKREELYFETATGNRQDELKKIVLKKREGVVGWVAEEEKRLIINDCAKDPRFTSRIDRETDFKTTSILAVPVLMNKKLLGVLEAINKIDGKFSEEDAELLEYIASVVAIPLQNAMLFKKATEETKEKDLFIELAKTISQAFSLQEVFDYLKKIICDLLDATEINVLVESQGKVHHLITSETASSHQPGPEETVINRQQVVFPLKTPRKRLGLLEIKVGESIPDGMISMIRGLSVFAAISIEKFEMYTQMIEKEKIEKELQIARGIQQSFLLHEKVEIKGLDVAYINIPSSEVGGDYYDIVKLDENDTIFTLNDISGHGIPASLLMSIFRTNFIYRIKKERSILNTLAHLNNLIAETTEVNLYVTSFTCRYDSRKRLLRYINAGHNFPFLFRGGKAIELKESSLTVGMFPGVTYLTAQLELKKKDVLILYTDGLVEAENAEGEQFSYDRLKEFFKANKHLGADEIKERLIEELKCFVGRKVFEDDVTFIIIKILK